MSCPRLHGVPSFRSRSLPGRQRARGRPTRRCSAPEDTATPSEVQDLCGIARNRAEAVPAADPSPGARPPSSPSGRSHAQETRPPSSSRCGSHAQGARPSRRVHMRGGARRPGARRSLSTLSARTRAPTKQMGPIGGLAAGRDRRGWSRPGRRLPAWRGSSTRGRRPAAVMGRRGRSGSRARGRGRGAAACTRAGRCRPRGYVRVAPLCRSASGTSRSITGERNRMTASPGASTVTSRPSSSPVVLETKRTRETVRSTMPFSGFSIANVAASSIRPADSSTRPSHVVSRSRPRTRDPAQATR